MKGYFKVVMLSLKIYENILKFDFLIGVGVGAGGGGWWGVLDILAVYANTLKQSFIDVKTMKCMVIYDYAKIPLN